MRIGKVVGKVTLSYRHDSLSGGKYVLANPLNLRNLTGESNELADEIVVYDELGAEPGGLIAISEGREAAQPFDPNVRPIDAYVAALLDKVDVQQPSDLQGA